MIQTHYFLERILEQISSSCECENFIFKGGFLLSNVIGIRQRSTLDIDFVIPSTQSKDKLVAIKEVLNGYLLIQIGGETEVTYNKWMVDFGMATAIPESVSRKPTFDYRG